MLTLELWFRENGYYLEEYEERIEALYDQLIRGKRWLKRVVMGYAHEEEAANEDGYLYYAYLLEVEGYYAVWNERDQEFTFSKIELTPNLEIAELELKYWEHFLYLPKKN